MKNEYKLDSINGDGMYLCKHATLSIVMKFVTLIHELCIYLKAKTIYLFTCK